MGRFEDLARKLFPIANHFTTRQMEAQDLESVGRGLRIVQDELGSMTREADALSALAALSPGGIWRPPLSPDQIRAAFAFGQEFYTTEFPEDPYNLWVLGRPKLFITLGTAFSRHWRSQTEKASLTTIACMTVS
jgi:hypothetical protein